MGSIGRKRLGTSDEFVGSLDSQVPHPTLDDPDANPWLLLISAFYSYLARRLSGPALERMRECAHLMKAVQPRNLGYMQLAVIEVTNCQIAPQLLKYFREV
jgi:hypothetical protein